MLGTPDGWRATAIYGFAHLGKSLFWYASELLFAYYLTELVGLSARRMGVVLAVGLFVSAAIDLIVGATMRRYMTGASDAARLQLAGSILCAATFIAVFSGFWVPEAARFGYAICAGAAFRFAYAVYDLPQNALMALATQGAEARDRVAATRIWFSGVAILLVAFAIGPLISGTGEEGAVLYLVLAMAAGLIAILSAWNLGRILPDVAPVQGSPPGDRPGAQAPRPALFWLLIALMVVTSFFTPMFSKFGPFFAAYGIRSAWLGGLIVSAMAAGIILGQLFWARLCRAWSRREVMALAAGLQIVSLLAFWLAAEYDAALVLVVASLGFGLGNGGVGMVLWAAFAELVAQASQGREGLAYGAFTATAKVSLGAGGLLLGWVLGAIQFRGPDAGLIVVAMTLLPAIGAALCLVIAALWRTAGALPASREEGAVRTRAGSQEKVRLQRQDGRAQSGGLAREFGRHDRGEGARRSASGRGERSDRGDQGSGQRGRHPSAQNDRLGIDDRSQGGNDHIQWSLYAADRSHVVRGATSDPFPVTRKLLRIFERQRREGRVRPGTGPTPAPTGGDRTSLRPGNRRFARPVVWH